MNRDEIIAILGDDWRKMTDLLRASLHTDVALLAHTNDSILSNSGKMLRPLICLLIARAIGEPNQDSIRYAAATELLHNATLMHDDVADESPQRRGAPTVSALLGKNAAVLVGDFWLARAVETVIGSEHHERVIKLFSKILVNLGEGEMLQLEKSSSADTGETDYFRIIHCKTASLFEVAGEAAADSVLASDELFYAARAFSFAFGMAFQIKDDILDYAGTDELGKPVGVDLMEQKITLPLLGALKGSPRESEMREKVKNIHLHPEYCGEVHRFVIDGGGIEYAAGFLNDYISKAVKSLDAFPDSRAKDALAQIADYNIFRQV